VFLRKWQRWSARGEARASVGVWGFGVGRERKKDGRRDQELLGIAGYRWEGCPLAARGWSGKGSATPSPSACPLQHALYMSARTKITCIVRDTRRLSSAHVSQQHGCRPVIRLQPGCSHAHVACQARTLIRIRTLTLTLNSRPFNVVVGAAALKCAQGAPAPRPPLAQRRGGAADPLAGACLG
jgi:hypothetical protein